MKAKTFLLFTFILLSTATLSAQYGGNGYSGYGNGYGGSLINQPSQPDNKPKEIPIEVTAAKLVEDMKLPLNLDELQVIAINNVLKESLREQGILIKQEYSQEDQIKNFKALAETTDQKINQFLSKEQKEKYIIYKEDRLTKKKTKEKSKKKKEKEEKQE
ncbi:MAG: hypothetical protein V4572_05245 [Bacteroidota bacterium]